MKVRRAANEVRRVGRTDRNMIGCGCGGIEVKSGKWRKESEEAEARVGPNRSKVE